MSPRGACSSADGTPRVADPEDVVDVRRSGQAAAFCGESMALGVEAVPMDPGLMPA